MTREDGLYQPSSTLLAQVARGEVPLSGSDLADHNLAQVIALMQDPDINNRDWATMLVAMSDVDSPVIRQALLTAARDKDAVVRGEALVGLAVRDRDLTRPLVAHELLRSDCEFASFEAAQEIADPSLLPALRRRHEQEKLKHVQGVIADAIAACEKALPLNGTEP